jgi:hypothetical protein
MAQKNGKPQQHDVNLWFTARQANDESLPPSMSIVAAEGCRLA